MSRSARSSMLDTVYRIATPEGIELDLRLAGPAPRALAWLLDFLWRFAVLIAAGMVLGRWGEIGVGVWLLLWFFLEWLLPGILEKRWGTTPGKKALGLNVVRDDGAPLTWGAAMTRNLLRAADFLPLFYLGGLLTMLGNDRFKRLGDLIAGTVVVYADAELSARKVPRAAPLLPNQPLRLEEARTILDFCERSEQLGHERAAELAALAQPWLVGSSAPALDQLHGIANHLLGQEAEVRADAYAAT